MTGEHRIKVIVPIPMDAAGVTASFEAVLTGHDGRKVNFFNTNFWRIREGKFQEVYVYFSDENVLV